MLSAIIVIWNFEGLTLGFPWSDKERRKKEKPLTL
jgi:hypothetical protein